MVSMSLYKYYYTYFKSLVENESDSSVNLMNYSWHKIIESINKCFIFCNLFSFVDRPRNSMCHNNVEYSFNTHLRRLNVIFRLIWSPPWIITCILCFNNLNVTSKVQHVYYREKLVYKQSSKLRFSTSL